jgi:cellulose 1,4-beta-cellobiosidase
MQTSISVLLDSKLKLAHDSSLANCYDDNECSSSLCPDPKTYSNNCVIDGADYSGIYVITTSVNSLKLVFTKNEPCSTNIESRVYLFMDEQKLSDF